MSSQVLLSWPETGWIHFEGKNDSVQQSRAIMALLLGNQGNYLNNHFWPIKKARVPFLLCYTKNLIFKCDLDLGSTRTNVSNGTSTHDGEQMSQIILNPFTIVEGMVWKNSDTHTHTPAHTHTHTHAHTPNCHCDNYVSLTASSTIKWSRHEC